MQVSDPTRTVLDLLDCPALGGGIRSVVDIVSNYFSSTNRDDNLFLDYAKKLGNRTVYKRLGYLSEILRLDAPELVAVCTDRQSSGISLLEPVGPKIGKILQRWNLRLNVEGLGPTNQS